ncbi:MAG: LCP family protein [Armatimonadetes bacterium]|nr:LCP family protein [Armatimonadota bacterium]
MIEKPIPSRELRPRRRGRWVARLLSGLLLAGVALTGGVAYRLSRPFVTPGSGIQNQVREVYRAAVNPRDAFPGKTRLYVLVLGIDANHTNQGIMYTKNARSDTILVASLDLDTKRVGLLSIPRDARVELAYGRGRDKINAAHAYGGIPLAKATVEEFLGVEIDHYIVIKMYGTRNFVDALGGVTLDVEKDMDYDDNWGNLHIHLKEGRQHLDGEQAVGYVRFRHDDEGDFGRMRRQQQLVRAVAQQIMTPGALLKLDRIVDAAMENIVTDLSRAQLLALANLFRDIPAGQIHTGSLTGYSLQEQGVWYLDPSESKKQALVGWLLRGEEWYRNGLVSIRVHNTSGVNGAAALVRDILSDQGYHAYLGNTPRRAADTETRIVDVTGHKEVARQIARLFPDARVEAPGEDERPAPGGPDILVYVGRASARAFTASL